MAAAATEGLGERMVDRIARELGVVSRNSGRGGAIWQLPQSD
jgi:hypothetical protein